MVGLSSIVAPSWTTVLHSDASMMKSMRKWLGVRLTKIQIKYPTVSGLLIDDLLVCFKGRQNNTGIASLRYMFCRTGGHSMETVRNDILLLNQIAQKRRGERFQNGAVTLNKVKLAIERDSEGFPQVGLDKFLLNKAGCYFTYSL